MTTTHPGPRLKSIQHLPVSPLPQNLQAKPEVFGDSAKLGVPEQVLYNDLVAQGTTYPDEAHYNER